MDLHRLNSLVQVSHLTLQEEASGRGAYENQFRGHFDPNFSHNLDRGKKSLEKILNFGPLPLLGLRKITF